MSGWIKLRRSLKDWEWYDDHNATRLLIHLLVSVNYEDKKWKGILIKPGSMVLSWQTLSKNSCMTVGKCRTAMDKLVKSKEVTRYVTNKFQVVTLVKWEQMQTIDNHVDKLNDKQVTNKLQTSDKQVTTTKEYKEYKEALYYKSEIEFLKDWEKAREKILAQTTNIKSLSQDESYNFKQLQKEFTIQEFRNAIEGLFKQKQIFRSNILRPRHFLQDRNIEKYLNAFINKIQLYTKEEGRRPRL